MEQAPHHGEEIVPEIIPSENGVDIVVARRKTWHFTNTTDAKRYFRRQYLQFSALQWGIRALFIAGVANVARSVEDTVQTHDGSKAASAVIAGVITLMVEGLNERNVDEQVRMHREVMRRFGSRLQGE